MLPVLLATVFFPLASALRRGRATENDQAFSNASASTANYDYWCVGNCGSDSKRRPERGIVLMGGGEDVDTAIAQQVKWANGGDFLVLRESGGDGYNDYIFGLGNLNSVATVLTTSANAAEDSYLLEMVDQAEAIFFAGGDQWQYLQLWQGTSLQSRLQAAVDRGVSIGGTSAGCMIQGGFIYTAENDGALSDDALNDPFHRDVTIGTSPFLRYPDDLLYDVIIDTHFSQRNRMGRLTAFVARIWEMGYNAVGLGVDEGTALVVDSTGFAEVHMQGSDGGIAYVMTPRSPATRCQSGRSLTYYDVPVQKLDAYYGDTYDLAAFRGGASSQSYTISASGGSFDRDPYRP